VFSLHWHTCRNNKPVLQYDPFSPGCFVNYAKKKRKEKKRKEKKRKTTGIGHVVERTS